MLKGHGGNIQELAQTLGCRPEEIIDVSSNINALGPPPGLMTHLRERLAVICRLPEVDNQGVSARMAELLDVDEQCLLTGAGTTPFIHAMFTVLQSHRVLIVGPTYSDYADACAVQGLDPSYFLADAGQAFIPGMARMESRLGNADTLVVCNPNNPTGALMSGEALRDLGRRHPDIHFVIDESYLPFVPGGEAHTLAGCGLPNVVVLHSLSKIYRLPGLRLGAVIAQPRIIEAFRRRMPPWSLNSLAQSAMEYLLENKRSVGEFVRRSNASIAEERMRFILRMRGIPELEVFPSCTNFFLIRLPFPLNAGQVCTAMGKKRILIRNCANIHGLNEQYIRIALHQPDVNGQVAGLLIACIRSLLKKSEREIP